MPELRWILLGLGVLFCLGLWWREARRGRQAADSRASLNPAAGLNPATVTRDAPRRSAVEPPIIERELPPWNEPAADIDEAGEALDTEADSAAELPATAAATVFSEFEAFEPGERESMIDLAAERRPAPGAWGRIEPTIGDAAAAVGGVAPAPPAAVATSASASAPAQEPAREKIVTLRVAAPPLERFEGRRLINALRAVGLEHGKFSIFHKHAPDGTSRFSVASLVEPGTFDLQAIDGRRFPGVSFFAVLAADGDDAATVEDMLGTARTLAASLHGMLQDERGAPLSPQRLADLRADVAAWARREQ